MRVIFCFFIGIGLGFYIFNSYLAKNLKAEEVLSETITITPAPSVEILEPESELGLSDPEFDESLEAMEISLPASPTEIPSITVKPTKKPVITATPTVKVPQTVTTVPSLTPTIAIVPTLTPTPVPAQVAAVSASSYSSEEIYGFYGSFAGQYGVDANLLRHIAQCESRCDSNVVSPNGNYVGLYQFSTWAWSYYRKLMGEADDYSLRKDAKESIRTAAYVVSIGQKHIWPNCLPRS